jgi:hypothetical protein
MSYSGDQSWQGFALMELHAGLEADAVCCFMQFVIDFNKRTMITT